MRGIKEDKENLLVCLKLNLQPLWWARQEGALQREWCRIPERTFDVLTSQGAFLGCAFTLKSSHQEQQVPAGSTKEICFSEVLLLQPHPNAPLVLVLTFRIIFFAEFPQIPTHIQWYGQTPAFLENSWTFPVQPHWILLLFVLVLLLHLELLIGLVFSAFKFHL